mgnify:CR=1 FL=1
MKKHSISKRFACSVLLAGIAMFSRAGGLSLVSTAKAGELEEPVSLGINNPFDTEDTDGEAGVSCVKSNSKIVTVLPSQNKGRGYSENHIEAGKLKNCLPVASSYMNNLKDVGVNAISQHFSRRYDDNGFPYFGLEEGGHNNNEIVVQLYVGTFNNYFWASINPVSTKGFKGDIDSATHEILDKDKDSSGPRYLPASEAGFIEWQKWLETVFDYLDEHKATGKLAYIQIGNETDPDYAKNDEGERSDKPEDFYWDAYAKLVEKSYDIIKSRAPKTKIAIGALGAGRAILNGFQRPTLEYLSGKIDENGKVVNRGKRCGGAGCFDVYDYHDFSGYEEYKGRIACQPINCVKKSGMEFITFEKTPANMKKLLSDSGFTDKGLVIQQGGTYVGQDSRVDDLENYQSEEDQASFLVKRAVHLSSQGVKQAMFGTYIEHSCYKGTIHNWFTMMGLTYNGIPKPEEIPDCQTEKLEEFEKETCDGQLPCPDPGKGVKKFSYFSAKKLIETLKGSDWNKIEAIATGVNDVSADKIVNDPINVGDSKKFYDMETGNESGNIYAATDKGLFVIDKDDKITKLNIPQISSLSDLITAVEIHPKNENVIYFASDRTELLRSTDKGETWQEISKDIPTLGFVVLKIDPNKDIIYAEAPGAGIWKRDFTIGTEKSDWRLIGPGGGGKITSIAEDPSNPDNLYMTINVGGARKSVDGGKTWEIINRGFDYGNYGKRAQIMMDIAVHPKMGDVVLAASLDKYIYSSSNGGRLWEVSYKKPKSDNAYSQIAFDPTNNNVAYVGVGSIQSLILGVQAVRSGNFWPKIADGPTILRGELDEKTKKWHWGAVGSIAGTARARNGYLNIYSIAVNPKDAKELFFMTEKGLYKGRLEPDNTIKKFMLITKGLPSPDAIHGGKIVFNPVNKNIAYLTALNLGLKKDERTLGGVFKSGDGGNSWQKLTSGLDLTNSNYFDIEIDPKDPKVVYAGQFFNDAGGNAKGDLYCSVDSGQHWASIVDWSKITAGWAEYKKIGAEFISVSRYSQAVRLSAAVGILLENKNIGNGSSWNNILTKEIGRGEWTTTGSEAIALAWSIAIDPKNSDIIYLPYGDHAYFKSENGGRSVKILTTFEEIRNSGNKGDSGTLIVDEIDNSRIYAATQGPHQKLEDGGVMYSKDYGKTWDTIGGHTSKGKERNMPRAAMMDMLVEYAGEKRNLYVASYGNSEQDAQGGVYFLDDADSWQNIFPMDNTHSIAARKGFDVIYAGVDEKGLYKLEKTSQPWTSKDVSAYKIVNGGKTSYFAWWDWWNKCPRPDSAKPEMDTACLNKNKPTVSITVGNGVANIKITEIVPMFDTGQETEKAGYANAFASRSEEVKGGIANIILETKPVYIEDISDTEAPLVVIDDPVDNALVRGVITIKATATDNVGIDRVEFYSDNNLTPFSVAEEFLYEAPWDSRRVSDGEHSLRVKAFDSADNHSEDNVGIRVDNTPPVVTIDEPADNALVRGVITIKATATDNVGIDRVEFYRDADILLGQDTVAPYSFSWDSKTVADGSHSLYAKAYDRAGNIAQSALSKVKVSNPVLTQTPWKTNAYGLLSTNNSWNDAMGYHFTPLKDGKITKLGGFFNGTKVVKLFNKSTGTLLASATVTAGNTWSYASITPISVKSGITYTVAVYLKGSGGSLRIRRDRKALLPRTFGDIRIQASAYTSTYYNPSARPTNSSYTAMYGQADVEFVPGG